MAQGLGGGSQEAFVQALRTELEAFQKFHDLLQSEQSALVSGNLEDLLGLAQRKSAQVALLGRMADGRNRHLQSATGLIDQAGVTAWEARYDPDGRSGAGRAWGELLALARSAKRLNEENGALINMKLQHNQQALAVLHGVATQTTNLYGPDGQAYNASLGRPLGKA